MMDIVNMVPSVDHYAISFYYRTTLSAHKDSECFTLSVQSVAFKNYRLDFGRLTI